MFRTAWPWSLAVFKQQPAVGFQVFRAALVMWRIWLRPSESRSAHFAVQTSNHLAINVHRHPRYTADWKQSHRIGLQTACRYQTTNPAQLPLFAPQFGRILTGSIQTPTLMSDARTSASPAFKRDGYMAMAPLPVPKSHTRPLRRQAFEHGFHQMLSFMAWNQHMGIDGKASSVNLRFRSTDEAIGSPFRRRCAKASKIAGQIPPNRPYRV